MIERRLRQILVERLRTNPAVALLGPRQVGKTTLALEIASKQSALYLDLESPSDRARIANPDLYLAEHSDKLIILDEVHRAPELFQSLRGLIDRGRRRGKGNGQFLLLGSASIELLRQSGESLAGRISYLELAPIDPLEIPAHDIDPLWLRGGFPGSFLAETDDQSLIWRHDFIRTYLERDIPQLGPRIPAETLRRFWTMLAHNQSTFFNAAMLARGLGVDGKTVARYLDLLVDLLLIRRIPPWHGNVGKRLIKSPKVHIRDSGIAHALLGVPNKEALLGHPVVGQTWESFVVESLLAAAPLRTESNFYRSAAGAEIDLVLTFPSGKLWAIEVKRSSAAKLERGFHLACADIAPAKKILIYPGTARFPMGDDVEAMNVTEAAELLQSGSL